MTSETNSVGDRLHRALAALRGDDVGLTLRQAASLLVTVTPAVVRMAINRSGGVPDDVIEDVAVMVSEELLRRPRYAGQHPGEAMSFVQQLATWRYASLRKKLAEEPSTASGEVPETLPSMDDSYTTRDAMRRLDRLYRVLLLLAGRSEKYRRVRSFLDHRLGLSEEHPGADRTVQNRLAQDRSTGRRYVLELAMEHRAAFSDDDLPLLCRVLEVSTLSALSAPGRLSDEERS
jgi:hypothetical protein